MIAIFDAKDIIEVKAKSATYSENISKRFSDIKNDINNFKVEFNDKIIDSKEKNIKNQQVVCDILKKLVLR